MTRESGWDQTVVAVAGGKGGCGKTTVTLGLALALARQGSRPLAVDADVAVPDLHIRSGVDPTPGLDALADGNPPASIAQSSSTVPGVDVLPAGQTSRCPTAGLARLRDLSRPVLVDCPAGAGPDAAVSLRHVDACVLVTTSTPESRQDAAKTAAMADSLDVPVVATVRRVLGEDADDAPPAPSAPGSNEPIGAQRPAGAPPVVAVPTVSGPPLADAGLLDRFDQLGRLVARRAAATRPATTRP